MRYYEIINESVLEESLASKLSAAAIASSIVFGAVGNANATESNYDALLDKGIKTSSEFYKSLQTKDWKRIAKASDNMQEYFDGVLGKDKQHFNVDQAIPYDEFKKRVGEGIEKQILELPSTQRAQAEVLFTPKNIDMVIEASYQILSNNTNVFGGFSKYMQTLDNIIEKVNSPEFKNIADATAEYVVVKGKIPESDLDEGVSENIKNFLTKAKETIVNFGNKMKSMLQDTLKVKQSKEYKIVKKYVPALAFMVDLREVMQKQLSGSKI